MSKDATGIIAWLRSWFDEIYAPISATSGAITYNITSSNYNPSVNDSVTITVTVKQGINPVSNHSFVLDANGTNVNLTTNSNGVATYTYTCTAFGMCRFSVETYALFIYVDGMSKNDINSALNSKSNTNHTHGTWTSQACTSYGTLYINSAIRICEFIYYRTNYNVTSTSEITLHSNAIPSEYCPKMNKYTIASALTLMGRVGTDGSIYARSSATGSKNINLSFMWHY